MSVNEKNKKGAQESEVTIILRLIILQHIDQIDWWSYKMILVAYLYSFIILSGSTLILERVPEAQVFPTE